MVARKQHRKLFPQTKISETFLIFAAPLSDAMGSEITKNRFEKILTIAFTVWNSVVLDTVAGNSKHVAHIRRLTAGDPMMAAMIEQIICRKKDIFPDDHRLIGEYTLAHKNGEWRLWAEARSPIPLD